MSNEILIWANHWLKDKRNEDLWKKFKKSANEEWNKGSRRDSARRIVEQLRNKTNAKDSGFLFKIDNDVTPKMARLWITLYPERHGFFEFRGSNYGSL